MIQIVVEYGGGFTDPLGFVVSSPAAGDAATAPSVQAPK